MTGSTERLSLMQSNTIAMIGKVLIRFQISGIWSDRIDEIIMDKTELDV